MNKNYTNYGVTGAMGENNHVHGNYFGTPGENIKIKIDKECLEELSQLSDKIAIYKNENVKSSDMRKAASIIDELVENETENNEAGKIESISKWKKFTTECAPAVMAAINLISAGLKNASEIQKLLGM